MLTDALSPPVGSFKNGLGKTYKVQTYGAWCGGQVIYHLSNQLIISGLAKIHFIRYEGKANWMLRPDLAHPVSFKNSKNGIGYSGKVRFNYGVKAGLSLFAGVEEKILPLKDGQTETYLANGYTATQKANNIKWNSASFMARLSWKF
ncbi:hypothetical protein [Candidatus Paracaedibacter symbiosus]|uniref:hypothetical protein n=1 Tax=Candidatus Paracaedibacter symbiosus TaxID=244582 RepID=UPI000509E9D9|nr:hypothetical protein [Candidatus Paracaedibacter symbiosus]